MPDTVYPYPITEQTAREIGDEISSLGRGLSEQSPEAMAFSLMLLCMTNAEIHAGAFVSEGVSIIDRIRKQAVDDEDIELLVRMFRLNMPRDLVSNEDAELPDEVEDSDREAVIARNLLTARLEERNRSIVIGEAIDRRYHYGYGSAADQTRCVRRILLRSNLSHPALEYFAIGLIDHDVKNIAVDASKKLADIPPSEVNLAAVSARCGNCYSEAVSRALSWALPEASASDAARDIVRKSLSISMPKVRRRAVKILLKDLRPDDVTSDFVLLSVDPETDTELRESIAGKLGPDDLPRSIAQLVPKLARGELLPWQGRILAAMMDHSPEIKDAFVQWADIAMTADSPVFGSSRDFVGLVSSLCVPGIQVPERVWETVEGHAPKLILYQAVEQTVGLLATFCIMQAHDPRAQEFVLTAARVRDGHGYAAAAVEMSKQVPSFGERVLDMVKEEVFDRFGEPSPILTEFAARRTDAAAQAFVSGVILEHHARTDIHKLLYALWCVPWSSDIVDAVETAAQGQGPSGMAARRLMEESRVPFTADPLPADKDEAAKKRLEALRECVETHSPLAIPPSSISSSSIGFDFLDYSLDDRRSSGRRFGMGRRGPYSVWSSKFVVEPDRDFWEAMPAELAEIDFDIAMQGDDLKPGETALTLRFANKAILTITINELKDRRFSPPGLKETPVFDTVGGRYNYGNPLSSKGFLSDTLGNIRDGIDLAVRPAKEGETLYGRYAIARRRKGLVSKKGPARWDGNEIMPEAAADAAKAAHPIRFLQAYGATPYGAAFDRNLLSVFRLSPAERVLPTAFPDGVPANLESGMLAAETVSMRWLLKGAATYVVQTDRLSEISQDAFRLSGNVGGYVLLSGETPRGPGKVKPVEGFYFLPVRHSDERRGILLRLVYGPLEATGSGPARNPKKIAMDFSRGLTLDLADGDSLGTFVNGPASGLVRAGKVSVETLSLVFRSLRAVIERRKTKVKGPNSEGIPLLYGSQGAAGNAEWLDKNAALYLVHPAFEPLAEVTVPVQKHGYDYEPSKFQTDVDPAPGDGRGYGTFYLIEESDGVWKRIRQGDMSGSNGPVVFPQFAGLSRRVVKAKAYLRNKLPRTLSTLRGSEVSFNEEGDLKAAFERAFPFYGFHEEADDDARGWKPEGRVVEAVKAALLDNKRSSLLDPR